MCRAGTGCARPADVSCARMNRGDGNGGKEDRAPCLGASLERRGEPARDRDARDTPAGAAAARVV